MKKIFIFMFIIGFCVPLFAHDYNESYSNEYLNRIAFPLGGIGAGSFCIEGTGALSHFSLRHKPDVYNEPFMFSAIAVKGYGAKVLEGQIPAWKIFGKPNSGNGGNSGYGLPRFENAEFSSRFPFADVKLMDKDLPVTATITAWSPFAPPNANDSSMPFACLEFTFNNTTDKHLEAVYSFNTHNFMRIIVPNEWGGSFKGGHNILPHQNGFILHQEAVDNTPANLGDCAVFTDTDQAVVDYTWFRGGWYDGITMTWKAIEACETRSTEPTQGSPGASIYVPFELEANESKTVKLFFSWYVPNSDVSVGDQNTECTTPGCCTTYCPWYADKFANVNEAATYWLENYQTLNENSKKFSDAFYAQNLPAEVLEAASANLAILKSPTVLRQKDGRLWGWEGCHDASGCCNGSCTHVWNYAQSIPRLFPALERSLRETEFFVDQDSTGHQNFRAWLPIRPVDHNFHAASDGQLGGIMKVHREWLMSGNTDWLASLYPALQQSLDYCIATWDPKHKGILEEPHHNTYDIEFWGPDGMCTSIYLGALKALINISDALDEDASLYKKLYRKGKKFVENELWNGEYFVQKVQVEGLQAENPAEAAKGAWNINYSAEALQVLQAEGPKYQYGNGCLSDGVIGCWIAQMCGLGEILDPNKVESHLLAIHKYNLKKDLLDHVNPQRATFACGNDGGLLLCTWPHGDIPSLPFVYSNEVWTGIEYQVASHLILRGHIPEACEIVRICRDRYDGRIRNPFNEYECGHFYARAMASFALLPSLSGIEYSAIGNTVTFNPDNSYAENALVFTNDGIGTLANGELKNIYTGAKFPNISLIHR